MDEMIPYIKLMDNWNRKRMEYLSTGSPKHIYKFSVKYMNKRWYQAEYLLLSSNKYSNKYSRNILKGVWDTALKVSLRESEIKLCDNVDLEKYKK